MDGVTSVGGLPLVLETMRAAGVSESVSEEVRAGRRRGRSGYTEAELVEAFALMLAAGGECLEDVRQLGSDKALLELLGKASWPSPDAARQFPLAFHDAEALAAATAAPPPDASAVIAPENTSLRGLARVMSGLASRLASHQRIRVATLERDETGS